MKYRTMGKLGIHSSAFGLGCMRFNGPASGDSIIDEQKAISLIRRAIDGGVNYIDTAYVYLDKTSVTTRATRWATTPSPSPPGPR